MWDSIVSGLSKGTSLLVSNADKIVVGYGGLLKQKASIALMREQSAARLAALRAQTAQAKADAAISNATAATAANNPTATGANAQVQKSPYMMVGIAFTGLALAFVMMKAAN